MKNSKGNKHVKNNPFFTLRELLKGNYYIIMERSTLSECFLYAVSSDSETGCVDILDAEGILDAALFKCEKDAESFLHKMIRNLDHKWQRGSGIKKPGELSKEDFKSELGFYRIMSIDELYNPHRLDNEDQEMKDK